MSILVGGAGWGVILRARSVKLEASGLLESQNGHCGAGACVEGHERVPRHIVGLGEQATACGKEFGKEAGKSHGFQVGENQACARKDPDWGDFGCVPCYRASRPQIQALKGLYKTVFLWLCLLQSRTQCCR